MRGRDRAVVGRVRGRHRNVRGCGALAGREDLCIIIKPCILIAGVAAWLGEKGCWVKRLGNLVRGALFFGCGGLTSSTSRCQSPFE